MSQEPSPDYCGAENRGSFSCNSACSVLFPPQSPPNGTMAQSSAAVSAGATAQPVFSVSAASYLSWKKLLRTTGKQFYTAVEQSSSSSDGHSELSGHLRCSKGTIHGIEIRALSYFWRVLILLTKVYFYYLHES